MGDGASKRSRRSRNRRAAEPYAEFYANYYGLDEPAGPPTRHRAAASRTGAALIAGLGALTHRKAVVILTLGISAVLVLAVGVMASATRTGSDPNRAQSLVDTTGSPTDPEVQPVAGGATTPVPTSSGAPSSSGTSTSNPPVISTPGNQPVYATPPLVGPVDQPTTQPAAPSSSSQHSSTQPAPQPSTTHHAPPPSSTHTTSSPPPPPPPPTSSSPTPTPSPSPTKKCIIPDPLHPGKCILSGP